MWFTFHRILRALSETNRRKTARRPRVSIYRPRLEALEDRTLLTACVVTTTADNGDNTNPIAGSLRDAINQVNAGTYNEIDFNITAASDAAGGGTGFNATTGIATIQPPTALLSITNSVIINGYTQAGASQNTLAVGDNTAVRARTSSPSRRPRAAVSSSMAVLRPTPTPWTWATSPAR